MRSVCVPKGQGLCLTNLYNASPSKATWNRTGIPKKLLLQTQNKQTLGRSRQLAVTGPGLCVWFKRFHIKYVNIRGTNDKGKENQRGWHPVASVTPSVNNWGRHAAPRMGHTWSPDAGIRKMLHSRGTVNPVLAQNK